MVEYIKKYRAFLMALIIIPIFYMLDYFGVIKIPNDDPLEVILITLFWWLSIALPIHNYNYIKRQGVTILKVMMLTAVFIVALVVDTLMDIPDNPVTFIILMGFWIGVVYLLVPAFIKKYWKLIALIYIPLFIYFLYLRLFYGDLETYLDIKKDYPFYVFFLPIPILFFLWVYEQWKWFQNLKSEKSKAELAMLQAQMNPHFFFNTLNNLYALTIKNSNKAPEVILKLSDMMRYTIYEGKKDFVTIGEEIAYLNNYIELHKIRYKKDVDIQCYYDVDTHLKIKPLLFIILLENAFKHGVESWSKNNAYIHMNLTYTDNFVQFEIENNFDGTHTNEGGIGLENLKRRLQLLFGKNYTLLFNKTDNTYKVTLKIPPHA
ncbi:sensor histidine kinase [Cellulophaga lytica]|uniref:sensor histidine kinase n=1 Tax=Cellulophaga lytica TaxID=979 RepID=UPI0004F6AE5E|nr:histidine kinase [Cellulophaga lytica]AIM61713.1 membrane protein [Cellulophaga lytica]